MSDNHKLPIVMFKDVFTKKNSDPFFRDVKELNDEEKKDYLEIMKKEFKENWRIEDDQI